MTHPHLNFRIEPGLRSEHRAQAAAGYWNAFARKLRYPLGPQRRAIAFVRRVLDSSHAISAVSVDGRFLGVAGFKTPRGAFVGGDFADLVRVYGPFGAPLRGLLVSILERPCEAGTLLMDGLFVDASARGSGVGTALLSAVESQARACGLERVRLDVVDGNPRARALYERQGHRARSTESIGVLRYLFGFGSVTTMLKEVGEPPPHAVPA
ncbi:N-acetyltransferase [Rhodoplanes elegans]|uniref:N-acetyltransferase n=1 Tax=Rhodoplanes elegans TaxID=29408 RepID=A0A327KM40_9BRAD|nr:GNAT family N-acetyltransferase [Rhodoplanes elegans]MBK5962407.1 N-acetyltransferase [Rhodoplanes elegans]RAI39567.1 N-acetyltransferase [Rhodoplanes elegans]